MREPNYHALLCLTLQRKALNDSLATWGVASADSGAALWAALTCLCNSPVLILSELRESVTPTTHSITRPAGAGVGAQCGSPPLRVPRVWLVQTRWMTWILIGF